MSKEDLAKRDELLREKKKKLTDPNYFISDIRLCIRNLPLNIDDNDLKATCYKYVKEKTCRISEISWYLNAGEQFTCGCRHSQTVFPVYYKSGNKKL
ncbi:unnamed protein product [Trichobilharzia regenti]|nr:unnamed protein product [Trichobilharzia regenti]